MRPEHLLHAIAGAKSQIARRVKFPISAAQYFLRRFVTVVTFRHGKPVEEKPCQWQDGIGLARRHLRRIFDRFYQVDSSLARKAEGCGLGLSIVKFIVDAHKGRVTVDSKPGQGSTFTVRLPVANDTALEAN